MIISNEKDELSPEKIQTLSNYVKLNLLAFEYLKSNNYKQALSTFEECKELATKLDDIKHVESQTNYGICNFFCGNFEDAYDCWCKAKEISSHLFDQNSYGDKQILYLHLRVLSNLSLTALALNNISDFRDQFGICLDLINSSELNLNDRWEMLHQVILVFFRIDSLTKYYEVNQKILENNTGEEIYTETANPKVVNKCLFGLHKSLREKDIKYWFDCWSQELNKCKQSKDTSGCVFIVINQMAACYYSTKKVNENLKANLAALIKDYQDQYHKDLKFKDKNINNILSDFKARFDTAIEIYERLWDLETDLMSKNEKTENMSVESPQTNQPLQQPNNNNKYLIRWIFKHAINYLSNSGDKNDDIKNQIEQTLRLWENDELDCSMVSIWNINSEITKSLKIWIENLIIIRTKMLLKSNWYRYKKQCLGYIHMKEFMQSKYITSEKYWRWCFENLQNGYEFTKINYTSNGVSTHFYQVSASNDAFSLNIYNDKNAFRKGKAMKNIQWTELRTMTVGCFSENLKKKMESKQLRKYYPWLFWSLHFGKRTIDWYGENDQVVNEWFLGLRYFMEQICKRNDLPRITTFFLNKAKLKAWHNLKNMEGNLPILDQIKTFSEENEVEFQMLSKTKSYLLYWKVKEKIPDDTTH